VSRGLGEVGGVGGWGIFTWLCGVKLGMGVRREGVV